MATKKYGVNELREMFLSLKAKDICVFQVFRWFPSKINPFF